MFDKDNEGYRKTKSSQIGYLEDGTVVDDTLEALERMNNINSRLDLLIDSIKEKDPEMFSEMKISQEYMAMLILLEIRILAETYPRVKATLDEIQGTGSAQTMNETAIEAIKRRLESRATVEVRKTREQLVIDAIMEYTYIQEAVKRKGIKYLQDYETLNSLCRNIQDDIIPDVNFQEIQLAMDSIVSKLEGQTIEG